MQFEANVELAPRTTIGLGGPARFFARAESEADVSLALAFANERRIRVRVLGAGSNVVIADGGVQGLVLAIDLRGLELRDAAQHTLLVAGAGEPWDAVVETSIARGLSGLECLSGIPGLVGAAPIQNVGAYGQEISDTLLEVRAFDRASNRFVTLQPDECGFAYRDSRFKSQHKDRFVITQVTFRLEHATPRKPWYPELGRALGSLGREPTLEEVREAVLKLRRLKSMVLDVLDENRRSCGSFFINPVVSEEHAEQVARRFSPLEMPRHPQPQGGTKLSAAWLIERSGLAKGTRVGNVGISSRHALALVCHANASSKELLAFASLVRDRVRDQTGVLLTPEPAIW